jgi:zona occludens toxin (predicted ATPase)
MEWVPIVFLTFKLLVLGTGMFFAIKWHYDQGKKEKRMAPRALLRAGGKVVVIFVLLLLGLLFVTFALSSMLGLDLSFT